MIFKKSVFIIAILFLSLSSIAFGGNISYQYDSRGRLEMAMYTDGTTIEYSYDNIGNRMAVVVTNPDTDEDGMPDYWEIQYFGNLNRDGTGDYDGDGISDLDEYLNGTDPTQDTQAPVLSAIPPGGVYATAQTVTLTADEQADIYYTLDGTDPDITSNIYSTPIEIIDNTVLKAFAVDTVGNQGAIETFEYIIQNPNQDDITVAVETSKGAQLENVKVYAFTSAGSYTGKYVNTDADGLGIFNLQDFTAGDYKFRVDYMGGQFWSDTITIPDVISSTVLIQEEDAEITVSTSTGPKQGVRVYLFTESGSYLGIYADTDADGKVTFTLPTGETYKFRADILGNQYWSNDVTITGGSTNLVPVTAGGGLLTVTLEKEAGVLLGGIKTYLFNTSGSYLNRTETTDSSGMVQYDVPAGDYRIRADLLGYQFWSSDTTVSDDTSMVFDIPHQDITITAEGVYQSTYTPISSVNVYLFTASGSYVNVNGTTDLNGNVIFSLPEAAYKVRVDYMGKQFWSEDFTWQDTAVDIPMADAEVTVTGSGLPAPGVQVYLFNSSGSCLNWYELTDTNGIVTFRLPADNYKFRADYQGSQYWSGIASLSADQLNDIDISAGGGPFNLTVLKNSIDPLVGVKCYVFNETGSYLNMNDVTNSEGQVSFDLADGSYNFRIDHLGYQFWTGIVNVPDNLEVTKEITHQDIFVTVEGVFQETWTPIENVKAYLFTPSGLYLNMNGTTDINGDVMFSLPETAFKVRVDYMGKQFWSDEFTWIDPVVEIPAADALITVTGSGLPMAGLPVYVYSAEGSYLNVNGSTDANGQIQFRLPAETYNFRSDYQGSQFWSGNQDLVPDQVNSIDITVGGGLFNLTVLKNQTDPLTGVKCYVFNENNTYLNMNDVTSSEGQVSFELAQGTYKFRMDYLGYQYWTNIYNVPATLSDSFVIDHQDVMITVEGVYQTVLDPIQGIRVYLFNSTGAYQNKYMTTDNNGDVVFSLPDAEYKTRADYLGQQYWSNLFQQQDTVIDINKGLAKVHATRSGIDLENARIYLFTGSGSYLNWYETSDATGMAEFLIPSGSYNFRADEGGDQVWSGVIEIVEDIDNNITIDLDGP